MSQPLDYTDPLFLEHERDKIAHEVIRGFKTYLEKLDSTSVYAEFLREEGLYAGPYKDASAQQREKFARVAETTGERTGPRFNLTLDGRKSVYIPGMAKHAFNCGAAEINAGLGGWSEDYKKRYQEGAKSVEVMARSASEAVLANDLNGALTAIFGRTWTDYKPAGKDPSAALKKDFK